MHVLGFDSDLLLPQKIDNELVTQTIDCWMQIFKTYSWSWLQVPCARALELILGRSLAVL